MFVNGVRDGQPEDGNGGALTLDFARPDQNAKLELVATSKAEPIQVERRAPFRIKEPDPREASTSLVAGLVDIPVGPTRMSQRHIIRRVIVELDLTEQTTAHRLTRIVSTLLRERMRASIGDNGTLPRISTRFVASAGSRSISAASARVSWRWNCPPVSLPRFRKRCNARSPLRKGPGWRPV